MDDNPLARLIKKVINESGDEWEFYDERFGEAQQTDFADAIVCGLKKLHPAELAMITLLIQAALELRYRGPHPDPRSALEASLARLPEPRPKEFGLGRLHHGAADHEIDRYKTELKNGNW